MAIYHLSHGIVSRSTGRSSVQSAAYITGEKLHESRRDLTANYQNRHSDIAFTATLAPEHAPSEFHNIDVWDRFEKFEDEYGNMRYKTDETREAYLNSAQTAQTIVVALPRELSVEVCNELVTQFAKERFVSRCLVVTTAIHDDEGNPHAHLQISRRSVNEQGEISWTKDRDIVSRKELLVTRKLWADLTNQYLEREGYEARITEKSFADLGIQLEPTQHRGWVADKLESMGITSRIVNENTEIFINNREALLGSPATILAELTQNNATFTQMNLLKTVSKRVGDDAPLVAQVFEKALQESIVVGEGMDGQVRYTSPTYKALEEQAIGSVAELASTGFEQPHLTKDSTHMHLATNFAHFSQEQRDAVIGLTQDNSLAVLVGRAGAGKTTTLKAVSDIYKEADHRVIGASLAAMAADNLGREANIDSATLHSWVYQWERYQSAQEKFLSFDSVMEEGVFKQLDWYQDLKRFEGSALTKDTVLIVDEAGMVGTRLWNELLVHVNRAGAKLIAVGDDNQFKAIEAGDFFRELKDQAATAENLFELTTIYRQKLDWMKDASQNLANLEVGDALSAYEQRGHVHQIQKESLAQDMAKAYLDAFKSEQTCVVLAFTNAQTKEINQAIRDQLKQAGLLDKQDLVDINGKQFAIGDKVVFLENDKARLAITDQDGVVQEGATIKNGTQGTLTGVNKNGDIQIKLEGNLLTSIQCISSTSPKVALGQPEPEPVRTYNYTNIAHGYAVTCHKAQGQTVDRVFVAASKHMDAKGLYVAMTRHRHDVQLFYAKEDFQSFKALTSQLSRFEHKDLVKDYTIRPENEAAWQRVQEYRLCVLDGAHQIAECRGQSSDDPDSWQIYRQIKQDQVRLGKEILRDFEAHKLYVNQAGLTNEMLQITTGQKARPLSNAEEKAKLTVELYGETAQVARDLWREIRNTHPGAKCYEHSNYGQFNELRLERNQLARTIVDHYGLHREFIGEFSCSYGISKRMLEIQSKQYLPERGDHDKLISISKEQLQLSYSKLSHNLSYGKYSANSGEYSQSQSIPTSNKLDPVFQRGDTRSIKQELNAHIKDLAHQFLGNPQQQKPTEWRYGSKGAISIHVAGHRQGLYSNFETGESGNALKFIQDQLNCDHKQAFKWGAEWLGQDRLSTPIRTSMVQAKQKWTPLFPAPSIHVDLKAESQLAYMLKGRQEIARYAYKDADSNILGYVVRLEDKSGHKITPTLTYCQNDEGKKQWRWQGFGNDRPLYGLDQLKLKPNAPVLIVEGEKTCEAAREIFKDHAVLTWSGGCGALQKSDWSVLKDRDITIWPDHDQPGVNAAKKISNILEAQGHEKVAIVDLPSTLPHKWDLADRVPDGLDVKEVLANTIEQRSAKEAADLNQSIKPSTHGFLDKDTKEKNESILNYLKAELTQERNFWLDDKQINHFMKIADQDPQLALQKWQYISEDDSFRPLTRDEAQMKVLQANQLLETAKQTLNPEAFQQLQKELPTHSEGVIDKCQEVMYRYLERQRDLDLAAFKSLAVRYGETTEQKLESKIEKQEIEKSLKELMTRYENDAKFMRAIGCGDDKNIQKVAETFKSQELIKEQHEISRGFER